MNNVSVISADDGVMSIESLQMKNGSDYEDGMGKLSCRSKETNENASVSNCVFT